MPTAAKLFGAVVFMVLASIISVQVKQSVSQASASDLLLPVNAIIGLVVGWRISGARAGKGINAAVGDGLTTVCVMYFWAVLIWGIYEMLKRSVRMRYDNPIEAVQDLADIMIGYSQDVITASFVAAAVFGSIACGVMTELVSRRWS